MASVLGKSFSGATAVGLSRIHTTIGGSKKYFYTMQCDTCKTEFEKGSNKLEKSEVGCPECRKKNRQKNSKFFGYSHPLYSVWLGMLSRCHCAGHSGYADYGGRGIAVCSEWRGARAGGESTGTVDGFKLFLADMGPRPTPKHSVGRLDNEGNYTPGNCAWQTQKEQANNTRGNTYILHNGEQLTISQWADRVGMNVARFRGAVTRLGGRQSIVLCEQAIKEGRRLWGRGLYPTQAERNAMIAEKMEAYLHM